MTEISQMNQTIHTFKETKYKQIYPKAIITKSDKIKISEPIVIDGEGCWEGEKITLYEDGKYYYIDGGIRKWIQFEGSSGYLEHDPEFWSGFMTYKTVKIGDTYNLVPYYKPP